MHHHGGEQRQGDEGFEQSEAALAARSLDHRAGAIAVVEIRGPLSVGMGPYTGTDVDGVVRYLKKLRQDKNIKAVLLRINTPGGSVAAVQEIHQEIKALREAGKIVVSSFGDVAASGGYYIAAASNKIVASFNLTNAPG